MVSKLQVLSFFGIFSALFIEISTIDYISGRAVAGQYPSTLAVLRRRSSYWELLSTGTLLHPRYALGGDPEDNNPLENIYILAGSVEWAKVRCKTCQLKKATHRLRSKRAAKDSTPILMYRVESPFKITKYVKPANITYINPKHGWIVHAAGFGHCDYEDLWNSPKLNWNTFVVSPLKTCTPYDQTKWNNYFCAYNKTVHRSDFIKSDYGAPVFYGDVVLGVAMPLNWKYLFQTVMRLGPYMDWLAEGVAWDGKKHNPNAIVIKHILNTNRRLDRKKKSDSNKSMSKARFYVVLSVTWLIDL